MKGEVLMMKLTFFYVSINLIITLASKPQVFFRSSGG